MQQEKSGKERLKIQHGRRGGKTRREKNGRYLSVKCVAQAVR
jgi:hypothetical protein